MHRVTLQTEPEGLQVLLSIPTPGWGPACSPPLLTSPGSLSDTCQPAGLLGERDRQQKRCGEAHGSQLQPLLSLLAASRPSSQPI